MIAKRYGTSATVLANVNDLPAAASPRRIAQDPGNQRQLRTSDDCRAGWTAGNRHGGHKARQIVYRVRAGETLSSIARRNNIPVSTLARLNNRDGRFVGEGQRLLIKASSRRYRDEGVVSGAVPVYRAARRHDLQHLASISGIGRQLKTWNGINQRHRSKAGKRLVMYVDANRQQG